MGVLQASDEWASHTSWGNAWKEEDANIAAEWRDTDPDPIGPVRAFCMVSYGRNSPPATHGGKEALKVAACTSAELTEANLRVSHGVMPSGFIPLLSDGTQLFAQQCRLSCHVTEVH